MEKLMEILQELHEDIDFGTHEGLIDEGVLDSFDIVTLVAEIDSEYGVTIPVEELTPENFNSAQAILNLIQRLAEYI